MRQRQSEKPIRTAKEVVRPEVIEHAWAEFRKAMAASVESLKLAGEKVAWLLDHDPEARDKFKIMGLSMHTVDRLERIGRGRLLPELTSKTSFFDHLPIREQRRVLQQKVPAVIVKPNGTTEVKTVNLLEQDSSIQNRVAGEKALRTVDEQLEYLRNISKPRLSSTAEQWRISAKLGKVIFLANSAYDPAQLEKILDALKAAVAKR